MNLNKDKLYYLVAILLFVSLKLAYRIADNSDLFFLLKPINSIVGLFTGSQAIYSFDNGYFYPRLNIAIDKSCVGFNFWILCFLMLVFLVLKYFSRNRQKIIAFMASFVGAYLFTIFVNSSRIFMSILVQNQKIPIIANNYALVHQAIGIITNLVFLILIYILVEKILTNRKQNAQLT